MLQRSISEKCTFRKVDYVIRAVHRKIDAEYLIDLKDEVQTWYDNVLETTKCQKIDEVSEEIFNKSSIKKPRLLNS